MEKKLKANNSKNKPEKKWLLFLKERFYKFYSNVIYIQLRLKKILIVFLVLLIGIPTFLLPNELKSNDTFFEITKHLRFLTALFYIYVFERASYIEGSQETALNVSARMEKGATATQMNELFLSLENSISKYKEIAFYRTTINGGNYGKMEITFKDKTVKSKVREVVKVMENMIFKIENLTNI